MTTEERVESLVKEHPDWYVYDGMYFSLANKAPPEARKAVEDINELLDKGTDIFTPFNLSQELQNAKID